MPATIITAANIVSVPAATGQPTTQLISVQPGGVPPTVDATSIATIVAAVTDALQTTQGSNPAVKTPANFTVEDQSSTTSTTVTVAGETFSGLTVGPKMQFISPPTTDYAVNAMVSDVFIKTGTGDDQVNVQSGRNIVDVGAGINALTGGGGRDTFIADATKASSQANIRNFKAGDDAVLLGVSTKDFTLMVSSVEGGKGGVDVLGTSKSALAGELIIDGYTYVDIGTKLIIGQSSLPNGTPFVFMHGL